MQESGMSMLPLPSLLPATTLSCLPDLLSEESRKESAGGVVCPEIMENGFMERSLASLTYILSSLREFGVDYGAFVHQMQLKTPLSHCFPAAS